MVNESKPDVDAAQLRDIIPDIEDFMKWCGEQNDWSASILQGLSIVSHSKSPPHPRLTFRFTVLPIHANMMGNLHGGCTSTIFDICTTLPLRMIARPGFWEHGSVSRTLNVTYLRPVSVGTTVDIECEIVHAGQRLTSLRGL